MKNKKSVFICLILVVTIFFNSISVVADVPLQEAMDNEVKKYIQEYFLQDEATVEIDTIKHIQGFNGEEYSVIECTPKGYFIVDAKTKIVLEYNLYAQSPYFELNEEEGYYGGVTGYYKKVGEKYVHTIINEVLNEQDVEQMVENCNEIRKEIMGAKKKTIAYSSEKVDYWVRDYTWLANRKGNFGYYCPPGSNGICGYIAGNIILKYWQHIGAFHLPSPYSTMGSTDLTLYLRRQGGHDDSYGWTIKDAINKFCKEFGYPQNASWGIGVAGVPEEIKTYRRPCILFGLFRTDSETKKYPHAIVAYGCNTYENSYFYTFICHFGWESDQNSNYSEVHVSGAQNGIFGSNTKYKIAYYK